MSRAALVERALVVSADESEQSLSSVVAAKGGLRRPEFAGGNESARSGSDQCEPVV